MVIVDSNIIINFWRHPDEETTKIFSTENIAICGVDKAELMHGARSLEDCRRILSALSDFPCLNMEPPDWTILGQNLYLLRYRGITLPFQDAIIATTAISHNASVWTTDKHFPLIKTIIPELLLF